jgi:hypothetical protein
MRWPWTLGLVGLLPLALLVAPELEPGAISSTVEPACADVTSLSLEAGAVTPVTLDRPVPAPLPPLPPATAEATPGTYDPDVELLGAYVWDGCTLAPADLRLDADRPDLHVRTSYVSDRRLPSLLGHLESLGLPGLHLGFYTAPRTLEALSGWRDLRVLTFEGDHLDDDALAPLSRLRDLRMLEMGVRPYEHNRATDSGLRYLAPLRNLEYLGLHAWEGVRGDGLRYLSHLDHLRDLELSYTSVDDHSLRHLARLPELRTLSLQHTRVTDRGLRSLAALPELRTLDLRQTAVTPDVADILATFPKLERVVLHYNQQFDVIEAVRARGIAADANGWIRGTVGCEHWDRTGRTEAWALHGPDER